jgi:hypothetical protein
MPVVPCFDPTTGASGGPSGGGGGSAYDVSPPAATTEATSAGVALSAKTFGSFTGADAGLIDGYTARTVNAVGSTAWSGSGLGAYTPSGGADGDAGVLALDATIGGVVVATALHDYSRAAAAGAASWAPLIAIDLTEAANAGPWTSGTNTVTDDEGDAVDVTTVRVGANTGTVSAVNGTGLSLEGTGSNSIIAGLDCDDIFTAASAPLTDPGAYVVDIVIQLTSLSANGYIIGLNVVNDNDNANFRGVRIISNGSGGYLVKARKQTTESAAFASGASTAVDLALAFVVCDGGASVRLKVAEQSGAISDPWSSSYPVATTAIANNGTQPYASTLIAILSCVANDELTASYFGIRRYS